MYNIRLLSLILIASLALLFHSSCEILSPTRNNPNDPKSSNYIAPPEGAFVIGNGISTNVLDVTLHSNVPRAAQMRFSKDGAYWTEWHPYQADSPWALTEGDDGIRYVYGEFKNLPGDIIQVTATVIYERVAPTGTMLVGDGDIYAPTRETTITSSVSDSVAMASMRFSNDNITWSDWEDYATGRSWVLAETEGLKTVYGQFRDAAGNVLSIQDDIMLDYTPQTGTFEFKNEIGYTGSVCSTCATDSVTIQNNIANAVSMRFSNDGVTWSAWTAYTAACPWTLAGGTGTLTVYGQFMDSNNVVYPCSATVLVENDAPSGSMSINAGAVSVSTTTIAATLNISFTDALEMSFSNDGTTWSPWEPYGDTKSWTLANTPGTVTVHARFRDRSGNITTTSDSIIYSPPPAVVFQNLQNKSVTCSGSVIIKGAVSNVADLGRIEVLTDGGTYSGATLTAVQSGTFMLPSGANTWRINTSHTITARATDIYGVTGDPVTITVRKGINHDINGDGYADLIVGDPKYSNGSGNVGKAYIFLSTGTSGITATSSAGASRIITGNNDVENSFGTTVTLGDINGDGYADAIIGDEDSVFIFHSAGSSGITATSYSQKSALIDMSSSSDLVLTAGDINGDGYDDVIASPGSSGDIYILYSSGASGITITNAAGASWSIEISGDRIKRMVTGDVNGDGSADLLVKGNASTDSTPSVYIFNTAGTNGITATSSQFGMGVAAKYTAADNTTNFGGSIALGDINGDGYDDAVIGQNTYGTDYGRVIVYKSRGANGITSLTPGTGTYTQIISGESGKYFGYRAALGDINGDGYAELFASGSNSTTYASHILTYIYQYLPATGLINTTASWSNTNQPCCEAVPIMADINGDGYRDVILGYSPSSKVYIYHSVGTGGISAVTTTITGSDSFGSTLY